MNVNEHPIDELIVLVNHIGSILNSEGITAKVDFDHRDGLIIIKYQIAEDASETVCVINHNNKTVTGIDASKLWMPDYSKEQKVNRMIINLLIGKGYHLA